MRSSFWQRLARFSPPSPDGTLTGRVRLDARTKNLCKRLRRGDVAVIYHEDLDPTAARSLIELRPAAVVNGARSITGRYPNAGPQMLVDAGIPLIDAAGPEVLRHLREGQRVELRGDSLWSGGQLVARGERLTAATIAERMDAARRNLDRELQSFCENTLHHLQVERLSTFADLALPLLRTRIEGRPVLIVVRGPGYKADLAAARQFIREQRPVLVGVDGGADALLEAGHRPDIILGDMDSASEAALRCGAELLMHAYLDGRPSPARERIRELRLSAHEIAAPGTSEDVAMLLAYQMGAELIVAVGTHFSLIEFLDKHRAGMASTFLTRLKVGSILVDAKGLSRLYRPALGPGPLLALIGSGLFFIAVLALHSPTIQQWVAVVTMQVEIWLRRHGMR